MENFKSKVLSHFKILIRLAAVVFFCLPFLLVGCFLNGNLSNEIQLSSESAGSSTTTTTVPATTTTTTVSSVAFSPKSISVSATNQFSVAIIYLKNDISLARELVIRSRSYRMERSWFLGGDVLGHCYFYEGSGL